MTHCAPLSDAHNKLRRGDVVLEYENIPLADDGTIAYREKGERMSHIFITIQKFAGDKATLLIWRNGEAISITLRLYRIPELVPLHLYEVSGGPTYFVKLRPPFSPSPFFPPPPFSRLPPFSPSPLFSPYPSGNFATLQNRCLEG